MGKRAVIAFLLMSAVTGLRAQEAALSEGQSLLLVPERSYTRAGIGFHTRLEDDALVLPEGKSAAQGNFVANSMQCLDSLHRVEGRVAYENGIKKGVRYNSSSDWELLNPYYTLDTLGGDIQREQYSFSAHYAAQARNFFYGLAVDYRTLQEYSTADPRPRNICSDLGASASAGLISGKYAISVEAALRKYHQSNSVIFFDPRGSNTPIIHYYGFGRYSTRFSGAGNSTSVRFKGFGYSASILFEPRSGIGWIAGSAYKRLSVVRHLPANNETPISELVKQELSLYAGKKWSDAYVRADLAYRIKQGFENITDQSSAFNSIGSLLLYREPVYTGIISAYWHKRTASADWELFPQAGVLLAKAENLYPGAQTSINQCGAKFSGQVSFPVKNWGIKLQSALGAGIPFGCELGSQRDYLHHMYERLNDTVIHGAAGITVSRPIRKDMRLYLQAECALNYYLSRHSRFVANSTLGIEF